MDNSIPLVKLLTEYGADINAQDDNGKRPIDYCIEKLGKNNANAAKYSEIIKILKERMILNEKNKMNL